MKPASLARQFALTITTAVAAVSLILSGCSSNAINSLASGSSSAVPVTGNPTMTQTIITDAANDQVLALGLTVNSIRLFDASGAYADVLTSPVTIEASHLDAVQEPLRAPLNIPQGTYTSALITVSNPTVVYVDPTTHKPVTATVTLASTTDTVTFASPITVSSTSKPICFDLLVAQSVSLSGSTATVTPDFAVTTINVPVNATAATNAQNGRINDVLGSVVSTTASSVTVTTSNGSSVTVATSSATILQGFTSLASLTAGQIVDIDVAQQNTGTLLALRIHLGATNPANQLVGPVTSTTGTPVTSFNLTARQWLGAGTSTTAAGTTYTVTVNSSTTFSTAAGTGTLPTLPFTPTFTAATLSPGQNVAVVTSALSGTSGTAASVTLVPQTIGGTVAAVSALPSGITVYTVTLPSGSAIGNLTGATTVMVYSYSSTQFMNATAITVGSTVRFNGLLFNDSGTLRLLGVACSDPEPTAPPQKH
jgi:hypothetical protein